MKKRATKKTMNNNKHNKKETMEIRNKEANTIRGRTRISRSISRRRRGILRINNTIKKQYKEAYENEQEYKEDEDANQYEEQATEEEE